MIHDRQVLVGETKLGELLQLVEYAADRLDPLDGGDALQDALRGSVAEIRLTSLLEPA